MSFAPTVAYKILTGPQKETLESESAFRGTPLDLADGFIHLSSEEQVADTLDRHFAGHDDLWIAAIDVSQPGVAIRWEASRGGALFPHLYAPLELSMVVACTPVERDAEGYVRLPRS